MTREVVRRFNVHYAVDIDAKLFAVENAGSAEAT